jgi:hypothetical protein
MHQPWASLVAHGVKTIEHLHLLTDDPAFAVCQAFGELPLGFVIATVEIVKSVGLCEESVTAVRRNKPDELPFGNFTYGRFGWLLKNPILLREPVPFRAHQGWPDIDDDLIPEYAR